MARTSDEAEEPAEDSLSSRTDARRRNRVTEEALARLSNELARLKAKQLAALRLPEEVEQSVLHLQAIASGPAKQRQLRLVRALLRDQDFGAVQNRLRLLLEHGSVPEPAFSAAATAQSSREAEWLARLIGEGFSGLDAFIAAHPRADRTHLGQLVQSVRRSTHGRRSKAEQKLLHALRGFLR